MPDVMNHLDLLVNAESAAKAYTSPIKLMEYMASGRPVLSARTPQCEAMLGAGDKDSERGWIYELGSKDSFTDRLLEWLEAPDDEIRARVVKARTFVEEHHTWDQRLAQILTLAGIPPVDRP
jgi:glycosyltransferase involved in cell wall biosynthesis